MNLLQPTVDAIKVIQDKSQEFRWYVKEDGTRTLQVACPVIQGLNGGFEWRDILEVKEMNK